MLCICWIGQYVSRKMLKVDGKMFPDLSGFLSAIYVHIHFRYQKGGPRAITYFSSYISRAEVKSKYGFKKSKGKTRFNTCDNSNIVSTASSKSRPPPNSSVIIFHAVKS